jgi:hypothetical protein
LARRKTISRLLAQQKLNGLITEAATISHEAIRDV